MLDDSDRWFKLQRPIFEQLWFAGCEHQTYNLETDRLDGCYMTRSCGAHTIKFDVEDAEKFEDIQYICIEIRSSAGNILSEGVVSTIEDVKTICILLEEQKIAAAVNLVGGWDMLENKVVSKAIAKLHHPDNWNRQEMRPKTTEEKSTEQAAYMGEWAAIDRECMPGILGFLSQLETNVETTRINP